MLKCIKRWYPNARSIGLDLDRLLIREARAQVPKATFVEGSALDIPLKNESVDLVIALHLVEHLPNPDRFMQEVRRILKPRGVLIIATPNPSGICANLMGTKWNGWSDHTHVNLQPPNYWRKLLRDHDLSILKDGTTALSGIPILRKMPFALINQIPLFLFGMFSWDLGESYLCISRVNS
jgi:SAM-dependent methyltransferase